MRLSELLHAVRGAKLHGSGDPEIAALASDSREGKPGTLFAALPGTQTDGTRFAADAQARGASAILAEAPLPDIHLPHLLVPHAAKGLGEAAAAFFHHPTRHLKLIGITGTNGKTTVAYLLRHALRAAGKRVGMLGTIEYDDSQTIHPAPLTTPGTVAFTELLARMVANGAQYAVVEVSSHALAQYRVWGHEFACGVFTNLTRDHLDYHGGMDEYFAAKKLLFSMLPPHASAVVNADDPVAQRIVEGCPAQPVFYGLGSDARLRATVEQADLHGTRFSVTDGDQIRRIQTPLVGTHNIHNVLAALGVMDTLGVAMPKDRDAWLSFPGVPGRLERFSVPGRPTVFVDYAHTDDALESVCRALRPYVKGRLAVVFGCGGDRDRGKRPLMAKAAEENADVVYVTDDNPRTEDPERIFADIESGFSPSAQFTRIPDRATAIRAALGKAAAADAILVAGKGHEDYQILGTKRITLDDRVLVREALAAMESNGTSGGRHGTSR